MHRLQSPAPWAPGTFWIPAGGATNASTVQALAQEFGLPFEAVAAAPGGPMTKLNPLRVGLYRRYQGGNIDEGWTRWIFDTWELPYARVEANDIRRAASTSATTSSCSPTMNCGSMMGTEARADRRPVPQRRNYPPEYRKGIGTEGVQALREFVRAGGSLVLIDGATSLATDTFGLPVRTHCLRVFQRRTSSRPAPPCGSGWTRANRWPTGCRATPW